MYPRRILSVTCAVQGEGVPQSGSGQGMGLGRRGVPLSWSWPGGGRGRVQSSQVLVGGRVGVEGYPCPGPGRGREGVPCSRT